MRRLALVPLALLAVVPLMVAGCSAENPADEAVVIITEPAAEGDGAAAEVVPTPDASTSEAAP